MHSHTAANELNEDHLLDFLVHTLTIGYPLYLGDNPDLTPNEFWPVLITATTDGTSISTLCNQSLTEDAPSGNDILHHLDTKFNLESVTRVGNMLLQQDTLDLLPAQVEFVIDFHLRPYYGDTDEIPGLYYSEAKAGTTAFHAYATLYARFPNKRYTLAGRRMINGQTPSDLLAHYLDFLAELSFRVKALSLDRGFYDTSCVSLLYAHHPTTSS